jgi:hypothetical protein
MNTTKYVMSKDIKLPAYLSGTNIMCNGETLASVTDSKHLSSHMGNALKLTIFSANIYRHISFYRESEIKAFIEDPHSITLSGRSRDMIDNFNLLSHNDQEKVVSLLNQLIRR